jgi:hypothetical protein
VDEFSKPFLPHPLAVIPDARNVFLKTCTAGTGFSSRMMVIWFPIIIMVKDATKVRLLTSTGLIDAKVVQVATANDLALLNADGRFAPLPIAANRTGLLGGTVATVGFPHIGLQGSRPRCWRTATTGKIAVGKSNFDRGMTRAIFKSACRCSRGASCTNLQRTEERMAVGIILTRICLAVCCGLGQTAVRGATPTPVSPRW